MKDEQIQKLIELNTSSEEAILKVGEFIRQTGNEVMDIKMACKALTEAILDMNKILVEIKRYIIGKE